MVEGRVFDLLVYMLDKAGPSAISAGESPPLGENQSVPTKQEIEAMLDRHKIDKTLLGLPDKLYAKIFFDEYKDKSLLSDDEHRKLFDFLWSINGLPDKLKFGLPVSLKKKIIQEENREKLKTVMGYLASGEIKSDVIELLKIVLEHPLPENEEEFLWECYDYKYANGEEERAVSSAINKSGGVDFSALPIVTQQIKSLQSLSSSSLSINPNFDLDAEWAQIQQIFNADIQPSIQRLLEFSVAASSSPAESRRKEDVIGLIADLLRREEENKKLAPTDPALKVLLGALEV